MKKIKEKVVKSEDDRDANLVLWCLIGTCLVALVLGIVMGFVMS